MLAPSFSGLLHSMNPFNPTGFLRHTSICLEEVASPSTTSTHWSMPCVVSHRHYFFLRTRCKRFCNVIVMKCVQRIPFFNVYRPARRRATNRRCVAHIHIRSTSWCNGHFRNVCSPELHPMQTNCPPCLITRTQRALHGVRSCSEPCAYVQFRSVQQPLARRWQ